MVRTNDTNSDKQTKEKVRVGNRLAVEEVQSIRRKEIEEILRNAAKPPASQLVLNLRATVTPEEIASLPAPGDKQNPRHAYRLYYKTLGRLRRRYILHNRQKVVPEEARNAFNKEVRVFLKKGELEADSRMAETKRMAEAVNIFVGWMEQHPEGDVAALYHTFCEANNA